MGETELKNVWLAFSEHPINEDECIDEKFFIWKKGTPRIDILQWFDKKFPGGVIELQKLLPEEKRFEWEIPTWYVDIPDVNNLAEINSDDPEELYDQPWINVETFSSKEEAIQFVKKAFGADDEGKICLISGG